MKGTPLLKAIPSSHNKKLHYFSNTWCNTFISRNKLKCNHLWLHVICNRLQLGLGVFATIRSNFNYFSHFYNYLLTIRNFIMLVGWFFNLFSSMNILICPIGCIINQINRTLKVFYND
jgi:hypothetical protein